MSNIDDESDSGKLAQRINEHVRKCMNYEKGNLIAYNVLMRRASNMLLIGCDEKSVMAEITDLTKPFEEW